MANDGLPVTAVRDLERAVREADIVSCATLSTAPIVLGAWLAPGVHLDLIGAFKADMRETASSDNVRTKVENRNLLRLGLVIVFGIFATTLPQPLALGRLPLQFLLKNEVSVTREQMAAFFFWCSLAWYLKPIAGILTDAFPLFRTRRRHYLLLSSVFACSSWIGMTFVPLPRGEQKSTALEKLE